MLLYNLFTVSGKNINQKGAVVVMIIMTVELTTTYAISAYHQ